MAEPAADPADVTAAAARWRPELDRVDLLSERERQVFSLLGAGFSNRGIASRLRVTERTVKAHVASILAKLGVESRLQVGLVAQVYQLMYQGTVSDSAALPEN
ncbi:helix-turn-helix transcriptional regulator [Streptomyces sp. NPDC050703]|uniref:helix-turn-helix transcriptional regulator n=1 Tax=Streptomyces sp. NPDC050703 TaxID=3157218 RepID=UPI00343F185B